MLLKGENQSKCRPDLIQGRVDPDATPETIPSYNVSIVFVNETGLKRKTWRQLQACQPKKLFQSQTYRKLKTNKCVRKCTGK